MSRWTYLPPRLVILALILLALWASADPLTRMIVVESVENRTGGKVDVAQLRCSIGNQKLYLKELVLADPDDPGRNLLQADMAYLEFDSNSLWRRQFVVTGGQTSRLMFGTPRAPVKPKPISLTEDQSSASDLVTDNAQQLGQAWLDNLVLPNNHLTKPAELKTTQASQQIAAAWNQELKQVAQTAVDIENTTANLNELASHDQSDNNPLRQKWQGNANVRLQDMETKNKSVAAKIGSLRERLRNDIATIERAQQADAEKISKSLTAMQFDGNQLSNVLLVDLHDDFVDQSVEMFKWFRNARPEIGSDFAPKSQRGVDIAIKGQDATPSCWIKQLEINGEGRFLGQHFDFSGNAYNLSTEPELLDQPATFEIHAQGLQHAAVACTLDHSAQDPIDTIKITCPELNLGERTLGHKDSLQLTLGDSNKVSAEVDLTAVGDQINGTIKLSYSDVALHVDNMNSFAGGRVAALQMNEGVTAISNFESVITIRGDQNRITFESKSDLGQQFAAAINKTLKQRTGNSIQQQLDTLQAIKTQAVEQLQSRVESQLQQLQKVISSNQSRIANLESATKTQNDRRQLRR